MCLKLFLYLIKQGFICQFPMTWYIIVMTCWVISQCKEGHLMAPFSFSRNLQQVVLGYMVPTTRSDPTSYGISKMDFFHI